MVENNSELESPGVLTNPDFFLSSTCPLYLDDSVCALIIMEDGRYLLQLREQKADITFPAHWCLFGGGVEKGEVPFATLCRELNEELNLKVRNAKMFTQFDVDLTPSGLRKFNRIYYEIKLTHQESSSLILNEGEAMRGFTIREIKTLQRISPIDAFALWLHIERGRLY